MIGNIFSSSLFKKCEIPMKNIGLTLGAYAAGYHSSAIGKGALSLGAAGSKIVYQAGSAIAQGAPRVIEQALSTINRIQELKEPVLQNLTEIKGTLQQNLREFRIDPKGQALEMLTSLQSVATKENLAFATAAVIGTVIATKVLKKAIVVLKPKVSPFINRTSRIFSGSVQSIKFLARGIGDLGRTIKNADNVAKLSMGVSLVSGLVMSDRTGATLLYNTVLLNILSASKVSLAESKLALVVANIARARGIV